ncbi:unnamed protein product [Rhizophagus irregularis]|nr:unnamed protein product [Rhizophagus irregularis]
MYIVYAYWDYRKENSVIFHAAFDNEVKALEFAEELGDGKESEGEYACQSGMLFDQHEKDQESLWKIAVDYVINAYNAYVCKMFQKMFQ